MVCEFLGARIVLNPQRVTSHHDYEIIFACPVSIPCCELRQLALRKLRHYPLDSLLDSSLVDENDCVSR
jgi:hypothetical protein